MKKSWSVCRIQLRLLARSKRRTHITHVLKSLRWLSVQYHVDLKMLALTFCALRSDPVYLSELPKPFAASRSISGPQVRSC